MGKKQSTQDVILYVNENHPDCKVISFDYKNNRTKICFLCAKGHIFETTFFSIKTMLSWCPACALKESADRSRLSLSEVKDKILILHPNCTILDISQYKNVQSKLSIICEEGHSFSAPFCDIQRDHWCPLCANKRSSESKKYTFCEVTEIIKKLHPNCQIIEKEYIDGSHPMKIICENEHNFRIKFHSVLNNNNWCKFCRTERTKATCIKRYGVDHPNKNKEIAMRGAKANNKATIKQHWETGEEIVCIASYESKTVDYLNLNKIKYLWQPRIFVLDNGRTYRPDLYLINEDKWIEIKGFFRKDALEKWTKFQTMVYRSELWDKMKLQEMGIL